MIFFYAGIFFQVICGVHAVKTHRYNWLWIILFFSLIGCLIYFIVEILPELSASSARMGADVAKKMNPAGEIKRLQAEFELCESTDNRQSLADALVQNKMYDKAINLLEEGLNPSTRDDPYYLSQLAHAHYLSRSFVRTKELLGMVKALQGKFEKQDWHLLYAMALNKLGENELAVEEFDQLMKYSAGEEARCRYALLLKEKGEEEKANELFQKIIHKCKISPGFYRNENHMWLKIAQENMKARDQ